MNRLGHFCKTSRRSATKGMRQITGLCVVLLGAGGSSLAKVTITPINYRGWTDALALDNGKAAAVVVPSIGRVMQFGIKGDEGVFWENAKLYGQLADVRLPVWASKDWINFGGDKAWPAPEGDWAPVTGRKGWRPPPGFDGMPYDASIKGGTVVLQSNVDPFYGVSVRRRIELHPSKAELTITTTFLLEQGEPIATGVWVVTQLRHPLGLFAPARNRSTFPEGFTVLGQGVPPSLIISNRLLSLTRATNAAYKIGLDTDRLLWVGAKQTLLIESPRQTGGKYPDQGSNAEIYTNPDPLPYIELEMLGPLTALKKGKTITHRSVYTLHQRRQPTAPAEVEARTILGP